MADGVMFRGKGALAGTARPPENAPRKAIPIVFVPGIMGSNLRVRGDSENQVRARFEEDGRGDEYTKKAWEAPNLTHSGKEFRKQLWKEYGIQDCDTVQTAKKWQRYGPKFRQILLNPKTTEVDDGGFLPDTLPMIDGRDGRQIAFERGWGTVHWDSYGGFLSYLQTQLNPMPANTIVEIPGRKAFLETFAIPGRIYNFFGDRAPTPWGIEQASKYAYPVFAAGYNWTRSNLNSAEALLDQIEIWLSRLEKVDRCTCSQVILVTHSMGGLVARIATELDKEAHQRILGVVHGVMPATGAPLLYRRMVGGTEKDGQPEVFSDLQMSFRRMAGLVPAETTPVIANSPGCLELLPSHLHPPGWLNVKYKTDREQHELSLPSGNNPYSEIYKINNKSYRMVDPDLLDPAVLHSQKKTKREIAIDAWQTFTQTIDKIEAVHRKFLNHSNYHVNSYAFYGIGKPTFSEIRWQVPNGYREFTSADSPFPSNVTVPIDGRQVQSAIIRGGILDPPMPEAPRHRDGNGDGTVPEKSGGAPKGRVYKIHPFQGLSHAEAYQSMPVRAYTVLAICKLVFHAKIMTGVS